MTSQNLHPFKPLDLGTSNRAELFRLFRGFEQPHYAITTRLDVTRLIRDHVSQGASSYRALLFAFGCATNAVPQFRTRFDGDGAVVYDVVDVSTTVPTPDGSFWFSDFAFDPHWPTFDRIAVEALDRPTVPIAENGERRDVIYFSCLPWIDVQSMTHAVSGPDDDIPRISWGRIVPAGTGYEVSCTVAVHHALVDGSHIGDLTRHIQDVLETTDFRAGVSHGAE